MRTSIVARDASLTVVAEPVETPARRTPARQKEATVWERKPTEPQDDLRPARGIFAAVLAGVAIWAGLGWGTLIVLDRFWS